MTFDTRLVEVDLTNPTYLLVSGNDELPNVVPLKIGANVFVGTGSNCKVQLLDKSVQQLHCMFTLDENNVLKVQDWNTGETYLNGDLVSEEVAMQSGDMVSVGCYCFTAVLNAEFHNGIAVDLLNEGGPFSNIEASAEEVDLVTKADQESGEDVDIKKSLKTSVVSGFNVGEDSPVDAVSETEQSPQTSFTYNIDADSEPASDRGDSFDSLPTDLGFAFGGGSVSDDDNSDSLLLMEVEQLRFELTDRDSQILALKNERDSLSPTSAIDDSDTIKLVARLEELLDELKTSDDRIQSLEDLLRLSEDAASAERDERAQIEKWVTEIENRVGQRQLESKAEVAGLEKQLEIAKNDAAVLQAQLHSVSIVGVDSEQQDAAIATLNAQIGELRSKLQQVSSRNQELLNRPVRKESDADLHAELTEAKDELAKLRLEASKERAETARRRVELENMRAELERHLAPSSHDGDTGDSRIRVMRQHLREIHEQEQAQKAEQKSEGLGGRIASLLSRLR